ncbi:hypothetical protein DCAR_0208596 [Daucus carota subsp. sativus]|uniref:Reverse transcriptase domain-containing protein n=1 Tax=Daucus carota subsp. sativus TaxID=79200 RepID=A0AAF0WJ76_DAUCS|nr:PREDICTED: uncharacterized protein LOC108207727 [Daucus carota subsp. sativus]WOG89358.1 hypothetical protein DCAR_0208596 [Daucus carota subsp. sativus]
MAWIRRLWPFISAKIKVFFDTFHRTGHIPLGANSSFIVLIPKKQDPRCLQDYRPISLINSVFKILSKVLANRIKFKLDDLISESQAAFVKGRNISDSIFMVNEIIHFLQLSKTEGLVIKLDFAKAYDSINWACLLHVMKIMGFGQSWCSWITACLSSTRMSILVNGVATKEFSPQRGLRQGDPLAPYLFIMVGELLNRLIVKASEAGLIDGIQVSSDSAPITHFQYADDTILVIQNNEKSVLGVQNVLLLFQVISGLKVNFHKSMIFHPSNDVDKLHCWASVLGCEVGLIPFKYLGAWVGKSPSVESFWNPLLASMKSKLSNWKAMSLNFAGRATLLQASLDSIPSYWLGLHKIPAGVCSRIEMFRRKFLWGDLLQGESEKRSLHLIKWQSVCAPKQCGGLGLQRIREKNVAFLGKWWWRFQTDRNKRWYQFIRSKYKVQHSLMEIGVRRRSPMLRDILSIQNDSAFGTMFADSCWKWKLNSGDVIRFWLDNWTGEGVLKDYFPRLFSLCLDKCISVKEMCRRAMIVAPESPGIWRRQLRGWECDAEEALLRFMNLFSGSPGHDQVLWSINSGKYSVHDSYIHLAGGHTYNPIWRRIWGVKVPAKAKIFLWKIVHGVLPTKQLLLLRIKKGDGFCEVCGNDLEHIHHLFWNCPVAKSVWLKVFEWWNINPGFINKGWGPITSLFDLVNDIKSKLSWEVTVIATLWVIWISRNNKIFRGNNPEAAIMFAIAKLRAFEWSVAANLCEAGQFLNWSNNPVAAAKQTMTLRKDNLLISLGKSVDIMAFVDGVCSPNQSGVGGIFLDSHFNPIFVFAGPSTHRQSVLTEFEAFLLACSASQKHWRDKKVVICSDSTIIVANFMKFKSGVQGCCDSNLDFSMYGLSFDNIWARKIDRALNQEADFLAHLGAARKDLVAGKI